MSKVLESYLIQVSSKVDKSSFTSLDAQLAQTEGKVSKFTTSLGGKLVAGAGLAATAIIGTGLAITSFLTSMGKADMEVKKYARSLWITDESAKRLKRSTEALGASLDDIAFIPELRSQFDTLNKDAFRMDLPQGAKEGMALIRDLEFQFTRFKNAIAYASEWVAYHIIRNISGPLDKARKSMSSMVDFVIQEMPSWTKKVADVLTMVLKLVDTVIRVGSNLLGVMMRFWNSFPAGVKIAIGALALLSLALMSGPVGQIAFAIGGLVLLIDDYFAWVDGRKSSKRLAPIWEKVHEVLKTLQKWFGIVEDKVKDFYKILTSTESVDSFNKVLEFLTDLLMLIWDLLVGLIEFLQSFYNKLEETGAISEFTDAVKTLWEGLVEMGKGLAFVIKKGGELVKYLRDTSAFKSWGSIVGEVGSALLKVFSSLLSTIGKVGKAIGQLLQGNIKGAIVTMGFSEESGAALDHYVKSGFSGEEKTWVRKSGNVNIEGMKPQAQDGLEVLSDWFYQKTGQRLFVTSAKDGSHAGGEYSHGNGWKFDIAADGAGDLLAEDPVLRQQLITFGKSVGLEFIDEYSHTNGPNWTGGHLDVSAENFKGVPQVSQTVEVNVNVGGSNASAGEIASKAAGAVSSAMQKAGSGLTLPTYRGTEGVVV